MSKVSLDRKTEERLVRAAQADSRQFTDLYKHYYHHIRRYFAVRLRSAEVIDDLTATTFEKALRSISSFQWQGNPFSSWLYRIANNTLVDYYRKQNKYKNSGANTDNIEVESNEHSLEVNFEVEQQTQFLQEILKELPEKERRILYFKFYEGLTNKDIAVKLNLSETNVGTVVYRIMKKLRKKLYR